MDEQEVKEILEHKERRDRFAMAALPALIDANVHGIDVTLQKIADLAYQMADAMIKARDA